MKIVFLEDLIILYGRSLNKVIHSHHAIQLIFSNKPIIVEEMTYGHSIIIRSNVKHCFDIDDMCISLLIDPESMFGQALSDKLGQRDMIVNTDKCIDIISLTTGDIKVDDLTSKVLEYKSSFDGSYLMDDRIKKTLKIIHDSNGLGLSISGLAKACYLSDTYFTHLFKDEIGLSVMRYIKWVKLIWAAKYIYNSGVKISHGSYKFEFADEAHFSRTFKSTFGINIKKVMNSLDKT